jgi:hypothetical protein
VYECVFALRRLCGRSGGTAGTGGINISAGGAGRPRVRGCGSVRSALDVALASAAGVTWTSRTTSAQWAGRYGHTSVVDAAGAIYVIGGNTGYGTEGTYYLNDVWASTDGGARPDQVGGDGRGYTGWVLHGYFRGTTGYHGYHRGTKGTTGGTFGLLGGY